MSSTNRGNKRIEQDEYQTPVWCVEKLLPEIDWEQVANFLEPCKGHGNIFNTVPEIFWKNHCEINEDKDYLKTTILPIDLIITNPPFSLAIEFLEKSLSEAETVIYLLRLNFLGSKKRREFWQSYPPTHLFVLVPRPSFADTCQGHYEGKKKIKGCGFICHPNTTKTCPNCGDPVTNSTDSIEYAWFCWDRKEIIQRLPGIYVL